MVSRIRNFFRLAFTRRYAMLSNTVSCVVLLGAADATEQCFMGKQTKELDWKRICRVAAIGVALGPMNTVWYRILQKCVKLSSPARMAVSKAFLDLVAHLLSMVPLSLE
uniref:Mitochondrial inner membrane protein Mpv17 n=1 Tax=Ditylenchus dipsaci TaxID=166011 RepID=A0A915E2F5_9BILA